jgi:hypothetical protein
MATGADFAKWGLGLFIFGAFLTFGIIAHYCSGARWPTGELFMENISLWWACPWTLSVAAVQAGGLGIVALGVTQMAAARVSPQIPDARRAPPPCRSASSDYSAFSLSAIPATSSSMRSGRATTTRLSPPERTPGFWPGALHRRVLRRCGHNVQFGAPHAQQHSGRCVAGTTWRPS